MAQKKILSVGYDFHGGEVERVSLDSDRSLLDADIIVFEPGLGSAVRAVRAVRADYEHYFARERLEHWKRELAAACEAGKTVLVLLVKPQKGLEDRGGQINSYAAIPYPSLEFVPAVGYDMRVAGDPRYLSDYWREFSSCSRYVGYIAGGVSDADILLKTRSGDRVVGAALRRGCGLLILAPPPNSPIVHFRAVNASSDERVKFDVRLRGSLVSVHDAFLGSASVTPPPDWASDPIYRLGREAVLKSGIRSTSGKIEILRTKQRSLEAKLAAVGALRRLLYEQGEQLEEVILDVLKLFGFEAESYRDADSEFDAVFTSAEGRFLGEAEGKDRRPIDINKLRQLTQNVQEDFERDEVESHAKGVLFGNPYRLRPPDERPDDFTKKCVSSAGHSRVALVRTADMFEPARYLSENDDPDYARQCRVAIQQCEGEVVVFPPPPSG